MCKEGPISPCRQLTVCRGRQACGKQHRCTDWGAKEKDQFILAAGRSQANIPKETALGSDLTVGFDYEGKSKGNSRWAHRIKQKPATRKCDPNPRDSKETNLTVLKKPHQSGDRKLMRKAEV